ncbi:MAG: MarR family transcriptional regulator [Chloroflexi bacterium]|nr:MarR family transcriptional regulator [Chloroflexota bacterium]
MSPGLFDRLNQEMQARDKTPGLTMSDVLVLPEAERRLLNWMMRADEVSLAEVADRLQADETAARARLAELMEKGYVREIDIHGDVRYRVRLAPKRGREIPLNIWSALDDKVDK